MKFTNTTDFPNHFLRRLVSWCCRELELPAKAVSSAEFRNRTDGFCSGHAWPHSGRFVVSIGLCLIADDAAPSRTVPYPERLKHQSHVEDLVNVTAHELAHLEQGRRGWATRTMSAAGGKRLLRDGGSEANTDQLAGMVMKAFHGRRDELLAAWSAEPLGRCARVAEKQPPEAVKLAKAQAALARWQRKAKLAATKIKRYKRQVAYYAKRAAERGK